MLRVRFFFVFFSSAILTANAAEPIIIGQTEIVKSEILNEDRRISVYLPRTYARNKTKTFDVLYVLDGGANLMHSAGSQLFLAGYGHMPELVIVGIHNTNRDRDFTPSKVENIKDSGGADRFREFIKAELMPFVAKNYRISDKKYLSGHSFGGLFAFDTLAKSPEMFDAYFTFSPSLRWDNDLVLEAFLESIKTKAPKSYLYVNIGNEGFKLKRPILKLHEQLKKIEDSDFKWHVDWLENENHTTTPVIGQFLAFKDFFSQ